MDCVDLVLVLGLGLGLILYCKLWRPLALPYMCPLPHFEKILAEWQKELREVLVERFRVKEDVAKKIQIFPATSDSDKLLLNGEQWLVPLQFAIIILLLCR